MNEDQKKRATELVSEWNTHYPEYVGDRMSALLQELIDAPEPEPVADGHVYVHVSGLTGSGKSAVAGEIEIAMRAIGLDVKWVNIESEKRITHADYTSALELYRPKVRIFEKDIPRTAPPANNQSEQHLEMVNAPAPSVPDGWREQISAAIGVLQSFSTVSQTAKMSADDLTAMLATQHPEQPTDLVRDAAPDIWRVMCGDWRDETVAIHNSEGLIADGLDLKKAAALVEAHNGSLGLDVDAIERDKLKGGAE